MKSLDIVETETVQSNVASRCNILKLVREQMDHETKYSSTQVSVSTMQDMLVLSENSKGWCLTFRRYSFTKDTKNTLPEGSQPAFLYFKRSPICIWARRYQSVVHLVVKMSRFRMFDFIQTWCNFRQICTHNDLVNTKTSNYYIIKCRNTLSLIIIRML